MPFTPYHFGPSGFIGLALRKWIDLPVLLLANVIVDVEVLVINMLGMGFPKHRFSHTLLLGAVAGAIWGAAAFPLRNFFKKIMQTFHIPYETSRRKMLISGVLGIWLHAAVDSIYHRDVPLFWPSRIKPLFNLLRQGQVKIACLAFFLAALILYAITAKSHMRQNKGKNEN